MPKLEYDQLINGDVVELEIPGIHYMACCSCGLTHHLFYREGKGKHKIEMVVYRDDRQTEQHRKARRFECRPVLQRRKP